MRCRCCARCLQSMLSKIVDFTGYDALTCLPLQASICLIRPTLADFDAFVFIFCLCRPTLAGCDVCVIHLLPLQALLPAVLACEADASKEVRLVPPGLSLACRCCPTAVPCCASVHEAL